MGKPGKQAHCHVQPSICRRAPGPQPAATHLLTRMTQQAYRHLPTGRHKGCVVDGCLPACCSWQHAVLQRVSTQAGYLLQHVKQHHNTAAPSCRLSLMRSPGVGGHPYIPHATLQCAAVLRKTAWPPSPSLPPYPSCSQQLQQEVNSLHIAAEFIGLDTSPHEGSLTSCT